MLKSKTLMAPNDKEDVKQLIVSFAGTPSATATFKNNLIISYKASMSCHTIQLGIYPNKLKAYIYTNTWKLMLITALLITDKTWKLTRYPSISEWKLWHNHTRCYSGTPNKKIHKSHRQTHTHSLSKLLCIFRETNLKRLWFQLIDILK